MTIHISMDKDIKETIIIVAIAAIIMSSAFLYVQSAANVDPTFTNVKSQSMQHDDRSEIGIIDTGDIVVLKNKEKYGELITYVDGYGSNYSSFGEYGMVVVYDRGSDKNPIIHRLILYMEYNETTKHWSAPSLANYDKDLWYCTSNQVNITDYNDLHGTFHMTDVGYSGKHVSINLDSLANNAPHSGYITMGDNAENRSFDQPGIVGGLVTYEQINSVAWLEIPWGGVLKMLLNGEKEVIMKWVPNSIVCIIISIIGIIGGIVAINVLIDQKNFKMYYKKKDKDI